MARLCAGIYFLYFLLLPPLNLIDLYFFEDKKEVALQHMKDLKDSIVPTLIVLKKESVIFIT